MSALTYKYSKDGTETVHPDHEMVKSWAFTPDAESEALLAHYMAKVAAKNGVTANQLQNIFPAVLRMLKSDNEWAK